MLRSDVLPVTTIAPARIADVAGVEQLLQQLGLPIEGLADYVGSLLVARENGRIVGSAAIEPYDDGVLLRSVAVDPSIQGSGLGKRLTDAALGLARERGARSAYLLTTTAEGYFARHGFVPIDRKDVPRSVQQSIEFRSACPASATVMRRLLVSGGT